MIFLINIILLAALLVVDSSCPTCIANETKLLNDGNKIPVLGYGTLAEVSDLNKVRTSVIYAIEAGFRHLNTADLYGNEHFIGQALVDVFRRGIVRREDIFITTKLDIAVNAREMVIRSLRQNLNRLQLDYVNLLLIHSPYNPFDYPVYDFLNVWKGMEDAKRLGLTKSIGISNFNSTHINRLLKHAQIRPAVNEIHACLSYTNLDLVAYCQSQGIVVTAYTPFGYLVPRSYVKTTAPPTFHNPTLLAIAKKYGKHTSQVTLRYLIDRGMIPLPKSHNEKYTLLNLDLFDFSLTPKEIYTINEFNSNTPVYPVDDDEAMKASFRQAYHLFKSVI